MTTAPANRNLGEQPLHNLLQQLELTHHDLVTASPEPLTHKMVARACKGRWLTANTRQKVLNALNRLSPTPYTEKDLFNY